MAQRTIFTIILLTMKDSAEAFEDLCNEVDAGIGGNPLVFVTPSPTLLALKAARDAMIAADVADNYANDASRIVLKERKEEVLALLRQLAAYVIGVAKGNRYIAALSGFKLSKEETTPKPTGSFSIKDTKPGTSDGEAIVRLASKGGYTMFTVEKKMPSGEWVMIKAFQLKVFTLTGLPSGSTNIRITGYKSDDPGMVLETVVKAV